MKLNVTVWLHMYFAGQWHSIGSELAASINQSIMTNDLIVIDFLAIHNGICIRANNVIGQVGFLSCLVSQLWIDFSVIKHDSYNRYRYGL